MPDLNERFDPNEAYLIEGSLLNEYADRLNLLREASSGFDDGPAEAEVGIFELYTNDADQIYDKNGAHINQNDSATGIVDIPDSDGLPIVDTLNGRWFGRFVYIRDGKAYVDHMWATLDTKLYSFANLVNANAIGSQNPNRIETGDETTGMIPEFAPFDKIPCFFFRQTGKFVPIVGPPEEQTYYEFRSTLNGGDSIVIRGRETFEHISADVGKVVAVRLEFYDPDDQKWYFYPDRVAYIPIASFGSNENSQMTITTSQPVLMKSGTRMEVTAAFIKDVDDDDTPFEVVHASFKVKCLGRNWQSNFAMFNNGHLNRETGTPIVNSYDYRDGLVRRKAEVVQLNWTPLTNWTGEANTRKRYRDTPEPLVQLDETQSPILEHPWISFEVPAKDGQPWYWTTDVTVQATIRYSVVDDACAKIPGVDFDDLPVTPADEVDYVLAIKDDCLVKVEVAECPEEGAAASAFTTVAASTFSLVLHLDTYSIEYTATGSVVGSLPSASSAFAADTEFIIMDSGANSAANNITINCLGTDTIIDITTGQTSVVIATNGGVIRMRAISSSVWKVF